MPEGMALAGASLPATSVPDSESLRRALLAASWQRDREIGRRRLRQRWAAWAVQRVGLAVVLAGGLGWSFMSLQASAIDGAMARLMSLGAPAAGIAATHAPPVSDASTGGALAPQQPQARQPARPALRLDLDPDPLPASTRSQPQLSTPGDSRT